MSGSASPDGERSSGKTSKAKRAKLKKPRPSERMTLSFEELEDRLGVSRRTIYRSIDSGKFPAPRKIGNRSLFDAAEINRWWEAKSK